MILNYKQENLEKYLKEISSYSVLSKEEENALFLKLKQGKKSLWNLYSSLSIYLKTDALPSFQNLILTSFPINEENLSSLDSFSKEEINHHLKDYETFLEGYKARESLIDHNLRLVVHICKNYSDRGIPFFDLIQEGNLGLMKAVDNYSLDYEGKFSTYAVFLIKRYIHSALDTYLHDIAFPKEAHKKIIEVNKAYQDFESKEHRSPTFEELQKVLPYSQKEIQECLSYAKPFLSLEELEEKSPNSFPDKDNPSPYEYSDSVFFIDHLKEALSNLTEREKDILFSRTGFHQKKATLESLSKKYDLSTERIRQIENQAKDKIRKSKFAKEFEGLLS